MKELVCSMEAALMLGLLSGDLDVDVLEEESLSYGLGTIAEAKALLKSLREAMTKLERLIGSAEATPPSTITIAKDYRIFHQGRELHMRPLSKTLFLFFLSHPEGMDFKEMPMHGEELTRIYSKLCPGLSREQATHTIERLLDPSSNSLDTQRWLLRRQFLMQMDEETASQCAISGGRAQKKRVLIDRARIIFE